MLFDLKDSAELLAAKHKILISAHYNPDGDAIGSMAALAHLCLLLGKEARIICPPRLPEFLQWLELPAPVAHSHADLGDWTPDLAVYLDCATPARTEADGEALISGQCPPHWQGIKILNIDHHQGNPLFGDVNLVATAAGATAELVGELAEYMGQPLTGPLGEAVYLGLSSDTGNFSYSSTTPNLMTMAARIVAGGLKVEDFIDKNENNWSLGRMRLWGELMQNLKEAAGGKVVYAVITAAILKKHHCRPEEIEGFVSFLHHLKKVCATLIVRERSGAGSKFSLRSTGGDSSLDVREVAAHFGGGGHRSASGGELALPPRKALKAVLDILEPAVEQFETRRNI